MISKLKRSFAQITKKNLLNKKIKIQNIQRPPLPPLQKVELKQKFWTLEPANFKQSRSRSQGPKPR